MKRRGAGSVTRNRRPVAGRAHRGILAAQGLRIETRPVRVESSAARAPSGRSGSPARNGRRRSSPDSAARPDRGSAGRLALASWYPAPRSRPSSPGRHSGDSWRRTATGCGSRRRTGPGCRPPRDGWSGTRRDGSPGLGSAALGRWQSRHSGSRVARAAALRPGGGRLGVVARRSRAPCESGRFRSTSRARARGPGPAAVHGQRRSWATPGGSRDSSPGCGRWRSRRPPCRAGSPWRRRKDGSAWLAGAVSSAVMRQGSRIRAQAPGWPAPPGR